MLGRWQPVDKDTCDGNSHGGDLCHCLLAVFSPSSGANASALLASSGTHKLALGGYQRAVLCLFSKNDPRATYHGDNDAQTCYRYCDNPC